MDEKALERRLPEVLAVPLRLVLRERCTYREAAKKLGLPPELVARRLRGALQELHKG